MRYKPEVGGDSRPTRMVVRIRIMAVIMAALVMMSGLVLSNPVRAGAIESRNFGEERRPAGLVTNDVFWDDANGNPIYSQGGGIFDFTDPRTGRMTHYWYGVHFAQAERYREDPTHALAGNDFLSVDVYSSSDLTGWRPEGTALDRTQADAFSSSFGGRRAAWVCRMGVAYVPTLHKYAMLIQHEMPTDDTGRNFDKKVMIATSDSPTGPFVAERRIDMRDYGLGTTNTGDQSVFQDEDGTGYLIYSYGRGRGNVWAARIGEKDGRVDLVDQTKLYQGFGREGNTMFKYRGKYYLVGSDLFGWDASRIHYQVADSIFGPYQPVNRTVIMDGSREDFGHITQTGFYYTLRGSQQETVIHCGDRWADFAGNGLGYNQWNPLVFDASGNPHFNSMSRWRLDAESGRWAVDVANDYVLNGSFEADRVVVGAHGYTDKDGNSIPGIAGWERRNPEAVGNVADSYGRVGDYDVRFTSDQAYVASLEQNLGTGGHVQLPDGEYRLSLQYVNPGGVDDARALVQSAGGTYQVDLSASTGGVWKNVDLPVTVTGGRALVKVEVRGAPGQTIHVDDIAMTGVDAPEPGPGGGTVPGNGGGGANPKPEYPGRPGGSSSPGLASPGDPGSVQAWKGGLPVLSATGSRVDGVVVSAFLAALVGISVLGALRAGKRIGAGRRN